MHCTGQTSTHARSFTSMHASVMMARPAMVQLLRGGQRDRWNTGIATLAMGGPDIYRPMLATTLIIIAMIAVPKRYESSGPESGLPQRFRLEMFQPAAARRCESGRSQANG